MYLNGFLHLLLKSKGELSFHTFIMDGRDVEQKYAVSRGLDSLQSTGN